VNTVKNVKKKNRGKGETRAGKRKKNHKAKQTNLRTKKKKRRDYSNWSRPWKPYKGVGFRLADKKGGGGWER